MQNFNSLKQSLSSFAWEVRWCSPRPCGMIARPVLRWHSMWYTSAYREMITCSSRRGAVCGVITVFSVCETPFADASRGLAGDDPTLPSACPVSFTSCSRVAGAGPSTNHGVTSAAGCTVLPICGMIAIRSLPDGVHCSRSMRRMTNSTTGPDDATILPTCAGRMIPMASCGTPSLAVLPAYLGIPTSHVHLSLLVFV